ncbi:Transporter major intrinsic protein family protein [Paragonimus heterotremus]|uniref:Transporter major intrinsic protein family protein n=1 Tax=Paragonimus heterotremus TaxID=100268 RepID=A0A8J4T2C4_9TREM|nr:Transporter major intrinsic protein family protein [Paragonimus heterotremus]
MGENRTPSADKMPRFDFKHCSHMIRIFLAEMIGLGVVCFMVMIYQNGPVAGPIVVGLAFTWVAWVFGPISGAQVNPAVTLALFLTRRLSVVYTIICLLAQVIGAMAGAWIGKIAGPAAYASNNTLGLTLRNPDISSGQAVGLEMLGTGLLILCVLGMLDEFRASAWAQGHVTIFPFAFGVTQALIACLIIYIVGPIVGGLLAALLYEMVLSDAASLPRLKAWFTHADFDRTKDYQEEDRNTADTAL